MKVAGTTAAERVSEWEWLVDGGESPERAARRLGVTVAGIARAAARVGRLDIASRANTARWTAHKYGEAA